MKKTFYDPENGKTVDNFESLREIISRININEWREKANSKKGVGKGERQGYFSSEGRSKNVSGLEGQKVYESL